MGHKVCFFIDFPRSVMKVFFRIDLDTYLNEWTKSKILFQYFDDFTQLNAFITFNKKFTQSSELHD